MYEVGSIIIIENQIFNNGKSKEIDHAKRRPALVICEGEDYFYYVTMTSKIGRGHIEVFANKKKQYTEIRHIYKKPISGFIEVEKLKDEDLLKVLNGVYNYHESHKTNEFKEVQKLLLIEMEKLIKKLNSCNKVKKQNL